MTDTTLTDTERRAIRSGLDHDWLQSDDRADWVDTFATVESIVAARVADRDTWWRERVAHLAELGSREAWSPDDWTDAAHDILRTALAAEARTQGGAL